MAVPLTTTFTARPGGIPTVEVGTITGDVELESALADGRCHHRLRYAGADEWYRVEGEQEPVAVEDGTARTLLHEALVDSLRAMEGKASGPVDPPHGSQQGRDADDPAAGSFGGARRG